MYRFKRPADNAGDHNRWGVLAERGALVITERSETQRILGISFSFPEESRWMTFDYHSSVKTREEGEGEVEGCEFLEGGTCHCSGTSLNLERFGFVEDMDDEAIWTVLEAWYDRMLPKEDDTDEPGGE